MEEKDDLDLQICNADDLSSDFGYDSEQEKIKERRFDLAKSEKILKSKLGTKGEVTEEYSREECRRERLHILTLDAYSRHKKYINDYISYYGGSSKEFKRDTSRDRTDHDVIREHHQFLWDDDEIQSESWERRLAKKYYDKLFKEYCIADLSLYKQNKVAMRWRTEAEVVDGRGQFSCGEKRCTEAEDLRSWEVNFCYVEQGQKKNALVKLRLCPECSYKLNYHRKKREVKREKKRKRVEMEEEEAEVQTKNIKTREASSSPSEELISGDIGSTAPGDKEKAFGDEKNGSSDDPEKEIWSKSVPVTEDKSRDEEFNDYFEDMFL